MSRDLLATVLLLAAGAGGAVASARGEESLNKAFDALKTYDWGQDRSALQPIESALTASHSDAAARKTIEARLAAVLKTDAPQAAKDFVCRQLSRIGTADSVAALAALLPDEKLSHISRFALERITAPEAQDALRAAIPNVRGRLKVGVINSLGSKRDVKSVAELSGLLADADQEVVAAAASALGAIGNAEAAKALSGFLPKAPPALVIEVADACLACAEHLLAAGQKAEAMTIYKSLTKPNLPRQVQLAATRGTLAVMGQKQK